jgi:hypothetical protein
MNRSAHASAEAIMSMPSERLITIEEKLHGALVRHSISALRITVGAVFLGFGVLKFFPDVSPAQDLSIKTIELLTFGLIPWHVGIVAIAALECFIGICLLANRWMRVAVWLLAVEFVGILAPLVLLTGRLFSGPHHAPTLEGQYVLKDIILVAAGMAIAAGTFRGGRLTRDAPQSPEVPRATIATAPATLHFTPPACPVSVSTCCRTVRRVVRSPPDAAGGKAAWSSQRAPGTVPAPAGRWLQSP